MDVYVLEYGGRIHGIYSLFELGLSELYKVFIELQNKNKDKDIKEPELFPKNKITCKVGNEIITLTTWDVEGPPFERSFVSNNY